MEGLPPFVQAGLCMHLKPELTFEELQTLAQNFGISLRKTLLQPTQPVAKPKLPLALKRFLPVRIPFMRLRRIPGTK
jgi:hypothetical protein